MGLAPGSVRAVLCHQPASRGEHHPSADLQSAFWGCFPSSTAQPVLTEGEPGAPQHSEDSETQCLAVFPSFFAD